MFKNVYFTTKTVQSNMNNNILKNFVQYVSTKSYQKQWLRETTVFKTPPVTTSKSKLQLLYGFGSALSGALGEPTLLVPKRNSLANRFKPRKYLNKPNNLMYFAMRRIRLTSIGCGSGFTVFAAKPRSRGGPPLLFGSGLNSHSQLGSHSVDSQQQYKQHQQHRRNKKGDLSARPLKSSSTAATIYEDSDQHHSNKWNNDVVKEGGEFAQSMNSPVQLLLQPHQINLPLTTQHRVLDIKCGASHTAILVTRKPSQEISHNDSPSSSLFLLGNNAFGQCAREIIADEHYFHNDQFHEFKMNSIASSSLKNHKESEKQRDKDLEIGQIVCGQSHTMLVTQHKGQVFCCGLNDLGQAGQGRIQPHLNVDRFTHVVGDLNGKRVIKIATSCHTNLALTQDNEVWGWGSNLQGQLLGYETESSVTQPSRLKYLERCGKIIDIAAGDSVCFLANKEGKVFAWGAGNLGLGPNKRTVLEQPPIQIPTGLFSNARVKQLISAAHHNFAITHDGSVYAWGGEFSRAALGLGLKHLKTSKSSSSSLQEPQHFPLRLSLHVNIKLLATGFDHSFILAEPTTA